MNSILEARNMRHKHKKECVTYSKWLLNHPHYTGAQELSLHSVWARLHSKHIWIQCWCCCIKKPCRAGYRYLSHQATSLEDDVEDGRPLNESKDNEETASVTDWRPADGGWKLHSSSGTEGAETHLKSIIKKKACRDKRGWIVPKRPTLRITILPLGVA